MANYTKTLKDKGNLNYKKPSEWAEVAGNESGETPIVPAPAPVPVSTGTIPPPTTTEQVDPYLQEWQDRAAESMEDTEFDPFSTGDFDELEEQIMAGVETPELFNAEEEALTKSELLGVPGMEEELNALKDDLRIQEAIRRSRKATAEGRASSMGAIEGRVGEIERQEMDRIDHINRMIAYKQDQLNTAYGAIQFMIDLKQIDFNNAMTLYGTQLDANLSIYKQLRSEFESDRTFEQQLIQDQRDNATATLQIYTNLITSGNMTYGELDKGTKAELKKLEVQSGLGIGFLSNLKIAPGENIKSITQRQGRDGYMYVDILKVNADGSLTTTSKRLGTYRMPSSDSTATRNSYGYTASRWATKQKDALSKLYSLEKQYEQDIVDAGGSTGTGKTGGDRVLADWEIRKAAEEFTALYGQAGQELLYNALIDGGYQTWDFKTNKVAPLSILGIK